MAHCFSRRPLINPLLDDPRQGRAAAVLYCAVGGTQAMKQIPTDLRETGVITLLSITLLSVGRCG
jgi:hypothetical protein